MRPERRKRLEKKGLLVLREGNEQREIEFEIDYLTSLSVSDRFALMLGKSRELRLNLEKNGHRTAPAIIRRK
jgi:hypothetical protein